MKTKRFKEFASVNVTLNVYNGYKFKRARVAQ